MPDEKISEEERKVLSVIGRRGGQRKGRKGFAAMTEAQRKTIQAAGVKARTAKKSAAKSRRKKT